MNDCCVVICYSWVGEGIREGTALTGGFIIVTDEFKLEGDIRGR